jgi:hypothetical protein
MEDRIGDGLGLAPLFLQSRAGQGSKKLPLKLDVKLHVPNAIGSSSLPKLEVSQYQVYML